MRYLTPLPDALRFCNIRTSSNHPIGPHIVKSPVNRRDKDKRQWISRSWVDAERLRRRLAAANIRPEWLDIPSSARCHFEEEGRRCEAFGQWSPTTWEKHIVSHLNCRNGIWFVCPFCFRAFNRWDTLKRHVVHKCKKSDRNESTRFGQVSLAQARRFYRVIA